MDKPRILRHSEIAVDRELVIPVSPNLEVITAHIEKHLGSPEIVWHEADSELVHVDIHVVAPTAKRNYYTLVTSGISDRPMNVPAGLEMLRFAELVIALPANWPMQQTDWEDERNYWPIRLLKVLARFPHAFSTWLGPGHTLPNGDPPAPYADGTKMCCAFLGPTIITPEEFWKLTVDPQTTINFFGVFPLYLEEMQFNLKHGMDRLCNRFAKNALSSVRDVNRKNACKKRFGLF
jgi:Suppressor of fused protein (SUFU)